MAANQRNFQTFTYHDDSGTVWNKRGEQDAAKNALDGSSALTAGAPTWPALSRRYKPREAVFQDPATFRTAKIVIYTTAAAAALTGSSTLAVNVPGETAAVTYGFTGISPEKRPKVAASRQLADHA
jgi:hypothetical protein